MIIGQPSAGATQVLFAFNTSCPFCRASLPAWNTIARRVTEVQSDAVKVYGLSLDSLPATRRYIAEHGLAYPVGLVLGSWPEIYRLTTVPTTVVLDSSGRVVYARVGVLDSSSAGTDSVMAAIMARLTSPATAQLGARLSPRRAMRAPGVSQLKLRRTGNRRNDAIDRCEISLAAATALLVCTSMVFGATEALATSNVTHATRAICPTTNPWAGECGTSCNRTCLARGYAEGACVNYSPTKKCCKCLF